jgi:DNA gyrase A subunit
VLTGIEKRPLSPHEKARVAGIISEKSRAMWGDEAKRAEIVEAISQAMASEDVRTRLSELAIARWQDPEYRARYGADHFSSMARTLWSDPDTESKHREKIGRQWEDETFRDAQRAGVQRSNARRLQDNPQMMEELTARARASLNRKWAEPDYKKRVMRQRIARYGSRLLAQFGEANVTPALYETCRDANWIPRLSSALTYFSDFGELLEASRHYNHRVVSTQRLTETADVYDITVDEYHNFLLADGVFVHNSIDGDPPAAMRYTEVRMSALAMEMLADIDKNTVNFIPNYDQSRQEPVVLPARFPNLLANGCSGIAVGMATNIPPHNLSELVDAIILLIEKPHATVDELMEKITGPDFPTSGLILGTRGIRQAYETGRGAVTMQAKTQIEPMEGGKHAIVITELPYQVNKAKLVEHIADLHKARKIDGITALNDYTDRNGMRVVIELRRDAHPQRILNYLLKHTPLRTNFGVLMLALVDGAPKVLALSQVIQYYVKHRQEVIRRRTEYDLELAKRRAHIVEGLLKAIDVIDEIIRIIRASRTVEVARRDLMSTFEFSELQAQAILEMQLQRLVNLERQKLQDEYRELIQKIAYLEGVLADPTKVLGIIKDELKELKRRFGDARRTRIVPLEADQIGDEDTIPDEEMIITITRNGYIKRVAVDTYRVQRRGGRGVIAAASKEEDEIGHLFVATTHHYILFFTDRGRVYRLKAYEVPLGSRQAMGTAVINLISIEPGEQITATVPLKALDGTGYLVMGTERGEVKRSSLAEFQNLRANGLRAFDLEEEDRLRWVHRTDGSAEIIMATAEGQAIRFPEKELRAAGRGSGGVRGLTLETGDKIIGMEVVRPEDDLLVVAEHGYGKRTALREYPMHHRGGKGMLTMRVTAKTGRIADIKVVVPEDRLLIMTAGGIVIRVRVGEIRRIGRATEGVRVINVGEDDRVVSIESVALKPEDEDGNGADGHAAKPGQSQLSLDGGEPADEE